MEGYAYCDWSPLRGNKCQKSTTDRKKFNGGLDFRGSFKRLFRSGMTFTKESLQVFLNEILSTYEPYIMNSVDIPALMYANPIININFLIIR